ncbi:TetR/AcrR family transcriptional regulator [Dactylosporangium sp. CA-233914]|uniref:TetR/AcrR family transcriptional regulator n=1 Tax=Dactylosporangium sp. CA-233914 TaxID=3239934 RepID=UPI003D92FA4E
MGLRKRKRLEIRARIVDAALDLALKHGLDGVEAISAAAHVSARTFFNCFESKGDALLNAPGPGEAGKIVKAVVAAGPGPTPREVAVRSVIEWIRPGLRSVRRRGERHELLAWHPHLFATAFRRMNDTQDALSERALRAESGPGWVDALAAAAIGAVRAAVKERTPAGGTDTGDHPEERTNALMIRTWETQVDAAPTVTVRIRPRPDQPSAWPRLCGCANLGHTARRRGHSSPEPDKDQYE